MELWAAGTRPIPDAIKTHLSLCDIHIVLLGTRYGSLIEDEEISYTEFEFQESKRSARPVIAFLIERKLLESALASEETELTLKRETASKKIKSLQKRPRTAAELKEAETAYEKAEAECEFAAMCRQKLWTLRSELARKTIVRYFDPDEEGKITADVINAIAEAQRDLPEDAGWIRAATPQGDYSILEKNDLLRSILDRIRKFSTLTDRLDANDKVKRMMGRAFWDIMLGRIKRCGFQNIFIESGSTLAYVADEFHALLHETEQESDSKWHVLTNNVVALLQLQLKTAIKVNTLPSGVPENKYGAILDKNLLGPHDDPPKVPRNLFADERKAIDTFNSQLQEYTPCLNLISASGLDLNNEEECFREPHVGGQAHMLIKHAILRTDQPSVLFLDDEKLKKPFRPGRCFPVLCPDFPIAKLCENNASAICFGFKSLSGRSPESLKAKYAADLSRAFPGYSWTYSFRQYENIGVILGANEKFTRRFEGEAEAAQA